MAIYSRRCHKLNVESFTKNEVELFIFMINSPNYTILYISSDPFYIVPFYIIWVTTSWTNSDCYGHMDGKNGQTKLCIHFLNLQRNYCKEIHYQNLKNKCKVDFITGKICCQLFYNIDAPEITANLYCNCVYLLWEGCVICSIYLR